MMAHYFEVKGQHPDCLLLYRVGDFYELFFDDAKVASGELGIVLTSRDSHTPMCGIPYHAFDAYVPRLVQRGFRVAVCDQLETPDEAKANRGPKATVSRGITRIFTASTITEDSLLSGAANNFLAAIDFKGKLEVEASLALIDISTGEVEVYTLPLLVLSSTLALKDPREVIVPDELLRASQFDKFTAEFKRKIVVRPRPDDLLSKGRLQKAFGTGVSHSFTPLESSALAMALGYVEMTQMGRMPRLKYPKRASAGDTMEIDAFTAKSLELFDSQDKEDSLSLFKVIDRTRTSKGRRLLYSWLAAPLTDSAGIEKRQNAVQFFIDNRDARARTRDILSSMADLERILSRASLRRASPRDLVQAATSILFAPELAEILRPAGYTLDSPRELAKKIRDAIIPDPPARAQDGGFIREGFSAQMDELHRLSANARQVILDLQSKYALETQVITLKVKYNNISGYFVEVPSARAAALMENPLFKHRQTLVGAVRFTTEELSSLESKILMASDKHKKLELEIFDGLASDLLSAEAEIKTLADELALIDVCSALAEAAFQGNWTRPTVDASLAFEVRDGRHPIVEAAMKRSCGTFIPNDARFEDEEKLWLLTGPNMAGKSTFLRQNAVIAIMAQIGSFVPASFAHIGCISKLFSRVGASDNLAQGLSTFMVEMAETAAILNRADERSFVILDEIGRGTATFDGLAIAFSTLEHLDLKIGCRGLFATHYHELTDALEGLKSVAAYTMQVREEDGEVVFMHKVVKGMSSSSYGIHVARIAGLPSVAIERAREVLTKLETDGTLASKDLFTYKRPARQPPDLGDSRKMEDLAAKLRSIDPDAMNPKEALEVLYEIKRLLP
jgi:DNA mismatch repair protein MutS